MMSYCLSRSWTVLLCCSRSSHCGACALMERTWSVITGTIATRKSARATSTHTVTTTTAWERRSPRRSKKLTAGFSPAARKSATTIRTRVEPMATMWVASQKATRAPTAPTKPTKNGARWSSGGPGSPRSEGPPIRPLSFLLSPSVLCSTVSPVPSRLWSAAGSVWRGCVDSVSVRSPDAWVLIPPESRPGRSGVVVAEAGDDVPQRRELGGDGIAASDQPVHLRPQAGRLTGLLRIAAGDDGLGLPVGRRDDLLGLALGAGQHPLGLGLRGRTSLRRLLHGLPGPLL